MRQGYETEATDVTDASDTNPNVDWDTATDEDMGPSSRRQRPSTRILYSPVGRSLMGWNTQRETTVLAQPSCSTRLKSNGSGKEPAGLCAMA